MLAAKVVLINQKHSRSQPFFIRIYQRVQMLVSVYHRFGYCNAIRSSILQPLSSKLINTCLLIRSLKIFDEFIEISACTLNRFIAEIAEISEIATAWNAGGNIFSDRRVFLVRQLIYSVL